MNPTSEIVVRAGKALAVHLIIGAVLFALVLLLTRNFDSASDVLRNQYDEEQVLALLKVSQGKLMQWLAISLVCSWLASALFVAVAQRQKASVRNPREGRRGAPLWIALFVLALSFAAFLWWKNVSLAEVARTLLDSNYMLLVAAGYVATGLAFWLATGLAVTITLKPSVPLAEAILPNFWNK